LESGVRSWGIRAGGTATNTFDIADFTAAATRLTIDSSGNLGIGTTTPGAKLEAYRNSSGEVARFTAAADGFRSLKFISSDNTGSGAVWTRDIDSAYAQHRWAKSGTPLMVLNESGNLGIGTTNPNVRLDVRGIIQGQAYTLPDTGESAQWVKVGTLTAPQMGRTVHIRAYIHAGFNANNNQDFYLDIFFKTSNGNSVDGSGFAGNSWYYTNGFNATNPTPKWVANAAGVNAASYDLYLYLPHYTNTSHYIVEMVTSDVTWVNSGSTGQSDPGSASSTVCIASLGFNVPIGNVGIGNTNPQGALHVTTSSGYNLYLDKSGGASIQFSRSGTLGYQIDDSSGTIRFLSSGSTPRAVIDSSGNFGIGTTNPSSYGGLVVSGTGYVSHINATSGAVGFGLYENGTGRFYIKTLNGSDGLAFIDGDGTSERARFTSDGHFRPGADNTYNLGATDYRWANIYTADLNLSNRDSQNDVDGTWGAWTIQEGENDLYLINRRNGKKFKFMLKEVE
jgi:hypothetical protein